MDRISKFKRLNFIIFPVSYVNNGVQESPSIGVYDAVPQQGYSDEQLLVKKIADTLLTTLVGLLSMARSDLTWTMDAGW
jgi:hypothetical protein